MSSMIIQLNNACILSGIEGVEAYSGDVSAK